MLQLFLTLAIQLPEPQVQIIQRILRQQVPQAQVFAFGSRVNGNPRKYSDIDLGACAAEGVEAKRVEKEPNSSPLLRTVAPATAGKTGAEWDFSPPVAADGLLPRRLLTIALPQPLGLRKLRQLKDAFEDSDLPICVDIVDWSLADADFKAAVEAQGMATLQ